MEHELIDEAKKARRTKYEKKRRRGKRPIVIISQKAPPRKPDNVRRKTHRFGTPISFNDAESGAGAMEPRRRMAGAPFYERRSSSYSLTLEAGSSSLDDVSHELEAGHGVDLTPDFGSVDSHRSEPSAVSTETGHSASSFYLASSVPLADRRQKRIASPTKPSISAKLINSGTNNSTQSTLVNMLQGIVANASQLLRPKTSKRSPATIPTRSGDLLPGEVFANKYRIEEGVSGAGNHIRFASDLASGLKVVLKFYNLNDQCYRNYVTLHSDLKNELGICRLVENLDCVMGFLPCLVFERGDYTLFEWMDRLDTHILSRYLALHDILKILGHLHARGITHGDLKPGNIMWFSRDSSWKLLDLDIAARQDERTPMSYTPSYAAPEIVQANMAGDEEMKLTPSVDMWAAGVIGFEILTDRRFYGEEATIEEITDLICSGQAAADPKSYLEGAEEQNLLMNLLCQNPRCRETADRAKLYPLFRRDRRNRRQRSDDLSDMMKKIWMATQQTRDVTVAANVHVSVKLMRLLGGTLSYASLSARPRSDAYTMHVPSIEKNPVFIIFAGEPCAIHVEIDIPSCSNIPIATINEISVRFADASSSNELSFDTIHRQPSKIVAIAWLTLEKIPPSANSPTRCCGSAKDQYVKVGLTINLGISVTEELPLKQEFYVKIIRKVGMARAYHQIRHLAKQCWAATPQEAKEAVNVALFAWNIASAFT